MASKRYPRPAPFVAAAIPRIRVPWLGLIVWIVGATCCGFAFADAVTIKDIEAAWRARQSKISTGDFRWTEKRLWVRASPGAEASRQSTTDQANDGREAKKENHWHTFARRLAFRNDEYRYEDAEPFWSTLHRRYISTDRVMVVNKKERRAVYQGINSRIFGNAGELMSPQTGVAHVCGLLQHHPILHHFQPFLYPQPLLAGCTVIQTDARINEIPCVVVRSQTASSRSPLPKPVVTYWLDREHDYCIIRRTKERNGILYYQVDVQYAHDPLFGPIPTSWKRAEYHGDGSLERSLEATVLEHQLNRPVANETFELTFPKHALVVDVDKQSSGDDVAYLVLANRELQHVSPTQRRNAKSLNELIRVAEIRAHPGSRPTWGLGLRPLIFFLIGLAAISTALFVYHRTRR